MYICTVQPEGIEMMILIITVISRDFNRTTPKGQAEY